MSLQPTQGDFALDTVSTAGGRMDFNAGIQSAIADAWSRPAATKSEVSTEKLVSDDDELDDAQVRALLIDQSVDLLKDGKITQEDGQFLGLVLAAEFETGGDKAVKTMAEDISKKLPDGMKFQISTDEKREEKAKEDAKKAGRPVPTAVKFAELFDKSGKRLGGIQISQFPKDKEI